MTDLRLMGRREELLNKEVSLNEQKKLAAGHVLDVPVQLEIHPYFHTQGEELGDIGAGCSNECDHCTRGNDRLDLKRLKASGVDPADLVQLIKDLGSHQVKRVVFSGNSTEPLLYPRISEVIQAVKDSGMFVRLYSNFHFGEKIDRDTIRKLGSGDVIRVSLDAASAVAYERSHHPRIVRAFEKIRSNVEGLLDERKRFAEGGESFELHLTFLLTSANSSMKEIRALADWANEHGVDAIRFNLPLIPKSGADHFRRAPLLSPPEEREARRVLRKLQSEEGRTKIITALEDSSQEPKSFLSCHHWKMIAVLGACGAFFPCTSVSLIALKGALGRDLESYGGFWDFWHDEKKWAGICPKSCAGGEEIECTRFEYTVNDVLDRLARSRDRS